jgi:hypothetical protein
MAQITNKDLEKQARKLTKQINALNVTQYRRASNLQKQLNEINQILITPDFDFSFDFSNLVPDLFPDRARKVSPKIATNYLGFETTKRAVTTAQNRVSKKSNLPKTSPGYKKAVKKELRNIQLENTHKKLKSTAKPKKPRNKKSPDPALTGKYRWIVKLVFLLGTTSQGTKVYDNPQYVTITNKKYKSDIEIKKQAVDYFGDDMSDLHYKGDLYSLQSVSIVSLTYFT